jgi:GTP-binding protein Era
MQIYANYPLPSKEFLLVTFTFQMKSGFVNIVGKPNAGKSTLLNALVGEKLAIVSSKVQTTRHRIRAFVNGPDYQIVFSDTPGVIEPKYKLHEKMMDAVRSSMEDADLCLLMADAKDDPAELDSIFTSLALKVRSVLVLNKIDKVKQEKIDQALAFFSGKSYVHSVICVSALTGKNLDQLLNTIIELLPEGEPYYGEDELTDMPTRFFAGELIREKIFELFDEEIPYQATVLVTAFQEKSTLIKISADIIVQRESQKAILLGNGGAMIKKLGTVSRQSLEKFLDAKVFLELFIRVRNNWRNNDLHLKEYGYHIG